MLAFPTAARMHIWWVIADDDGQRREWAAHQSEREWWNLRNLRECLPACLLLACLCLSEIVYACSTSMVYARECIQMKLIKDNDSNWKLMFGLACINSSLWSYLMCSCLCVGLCECFFFFVHETVSFWLFHCTQKWWCAAGGFIFQSLSPMLYARRILFINISTSLDGKCCKSFYELSLLSLKNCTWWPFENPLMMRFCVVITIDTWSVNGRSRFQWN